jgi:hypothetical protein
VIKMEEPYNELADLPDRPWEEFMADLEMLKPAEFKEFWRSLVVDKEKKFTDEEFEERWRAIGRAWERSK